MTQFDHLLTYAIVRLRNDIPLPVDMEAELVSRGYDIEALRRDSKADNHGFEFDFYGDVDGD